VVVYANSMPKTIVYIYSWSLLVVWSKVESKFIYGAHKSKAFKSYNYAHIDTHVESIN
jgi:hypothetical protein